MAITVASQTAEASDEFWSFVVDQYAGENEDKRRLVEAAIARFRYAQRDLSAALEEARARDVPYDPQLDHYNPKWLRIPENEQHYPSGTCMLWSHETGPFAGFWHGIRKCWVCSEEIYRETKREYHPTHYAPTPHSMTVMSAART